MANANIDALYAGSLRLKIAYFVSELFYFYEWCVTKVAHCRLIKIIYVDRSWENGGSVVECLTRDRRAAGSRDSTTSLRCVLE